MSVYVLAGQNDIVISGSDPIAPSDTVQVTIISSSNVVVVNDECQSVQPNTSLAEDYGVPDDTYTVYVYWDNGNSCSEFDGVTVPAMLQSNGVQLPSTVVGLSKESAAVSGSGAPPGKYKRYDPSIKFGPPPLPHPPTPRPNPRLRPPPHLLP